MSRRKRLVYDDLAAVWDHDHSLEELCAIFDVSHATLAKNAREAGLGKKPYKRITVDERRLRDAWTRDSTGEELAKRFGVTYETLLTRAKELGLERKPKFCEGAHASTLKKLRVIRKHLATGKHGAQSAAARALGITREAVSQLRIRYIDGRP